MDVQVTAPPPGKGGNVLSDPAAFDRRSEAGIRNVLGNYRAIMETTGYIPRDQGTLAKSIGASVVASPTEGMIGTPLLYGGVMEYGRRPGTWPNIGAIREWVRRKVRPQGRRRGEKAEQTIRSVAFLIARKIENEGIGIPLIADSRGGMFGRTLDDTRDRFADWFREGFGE